MRDFPSNPEASRRVPFIHDALADYGYLAAFVLVFLGAACLPVPVSLVMVGAGVLVARGPFDLATALAVIISANVLGDLSGYGLARRLTTRRVWARRTQAHVSLARLEGMLRARPLLTVAGSRFFPVINGGVNTLAGMCRLAPVRFAVGDLLGNAAVASMYVALGVSFGRAWGDADRVATIGSLTALLVGSLALFGVLAWRRESPE